MSLHLAIIAQFVPHGSAEPEAAIAFIIVMAVFFICVVLQIRSNKKK